MKPQISKLASKVLRQMVQKGHGSAEGGGVLLTGNPGIGKTSFTALLGRVLGIETIVIEVPHITEEHLINIPFLVMNGKTGATSSHTQKISEKDYKLVLADSNLYTQLVKASKIEESQYLDYIKSAKPEVQALYSSLGGTDTVVPPLIQQVRQNFTSILFLDEFYRQTSTRIRNVLRSILNGNIGNHKIPSNAYIMYASNMEDSGLDDVPSNHEFQAIEYKDPSSKDWFEWLVTKFEHDQRVELNDTIMKKFKKELVDEDIVNQDIGAEVRTSPRRWEQILLYVNSSLPTDDREKARALLTNVKNNFVNYESGKYSKLSDKVVKAVADLIKETSNLDVDAKHILEPKDWRSQLDHAVEQAMKLGEHRKHVPVVSGPPGVGKTTQALAVANNHDLILVHIDASELNAEDSIGIPIPGKRTDDSIQVGFSQPKLYQQILSKIKQMKDAQRAELEEEYGPEKASQKMKEFDTQEWKYLIFFDEINRVDERTFNSLRRVILEKNFGSSGDGDGQILKLPEGSIVIAAMNPEGVGTTTLTDHFRDVIDVIPAGASWEQTKKYLKGKKYKGIDDKTKEAAFNLIQKFTDKFKTKNPDMEGSAAQAFTLNLGQEVYVSPREYTALYDALVRELDAGVDEVMADDDIKGEHVRPLIDEVVTEAFEDSLNFVFFKHGLERAEFMDMMKTWLRSLPDSVYGNLLEKTVSGGKGLTEILAPYFDGSKKVIDMPEDINIININNELNNAQIIEQFKELAVSQLTDKESVTKLILNEDEDKVEADGDALKVGTDKVSHMTNFILASLFTLGIHDFPNDRLGVLGKAFTTSISHGLNKLYEKGEIDDDDEDEVTQRILETRSEIQELLQEME